MTLWLKVAAAKMLQTTARPTIQARPNVSQMLGRSSPLGKLQKGLPDDIQSVTSHTTSATSAAGGIPDLLLTGADRLAPRARLKTTIQRFGPLATDPTKPFTPNAAQNVQQRPRTPV